MPPSAPILMSSCVHASQISLFRLLKFICCRCARTDAPLSEGSGLGLDHSQVPQCQIPAMVSLFVTVHFDGHRPLSQKFHKIFRYRHR